MTKEMNAEAKTVGKAGAQSSEGGENAAAKPPAQMENGEDNKTTEKCDLEKAPSVNIEKDRIKAIKDNACAKFDIETNLKASGKAPLHAWHLIGHQTVRQNDKHIKHAAEKHGVDPDLVMSIMYLENAQGWYGKPAELIGAADTILPMNVSNKRWGEMQAEGKGIFNNAKNVDAGTKIIKALQGKIKGVNSSKLDKESIEKIGTLYNSLYKEKTTDYGARVAKIYEEKPWLEDASPDALFYGM
ncbi:MAG: hypothetical protein GY804_15585 [Alphaproteobacteria bacterium]|nr:hypothetical protein [Alphaproteobacteria bacterium]